MIAQIATPAPAVAIAVAHSLRVLSSQAILDDYDSEEERALLRRRGRIMPALVVTSSREAYPRMPDRGRFLTYGREPGLLFEEPYAPLPDGRPWTPIRPA